MYSKLHILFIVIISAIYFIACSDSPGPVGYSLLNQNDLISLKDISSDSLNQTTSNFSKKINNGSSTQLLLGRYKGTETSDLIKFQLSVLLDSIKTFVKNDSIEIINAKVEMTHTYQLGNSNSQFDFEVHKINSNWSINNFDTDSLALLSYDPVDASTNKIVNNDTLYSFELNNDIVKEWFIAESDTSQSNFANNGILLKPSSNTERIVGFQGNTTDETEYYNIPRILIIVEKKGEWRDTLIFYSVKNVYVIKGEIPNENSDYFFIQGGLAINAKLKFDLPEISPYSIINSANLELTIDTIKSNLGNPSADIISVRFLTDSSNIQYDSLSAIYLIRDKDKFSGDISSYVQRWIAGEKNYGMLLYFIKETEVADQVSIFSKSYMDTSKKPLLKIKCTAKK